MYWKSTRGAFVAAIAFAVSVTACKTDGGKDTTEPAKPVEATKPVAPKVEGKEVTYEADGVKLKGYLAWDTARTEPRPGVLVVHEWWGHNDYARKRADMLAGMGYTALAVDMYGDGKQAGHPDDAKKFMMEVFKNMDGAKKRFEAAKKLLNEHATTKPDATAAVGYCFGGAVVLQMARTGMDLDGVASFHGNLSTENPAEAGKFKAKVMVAHGAADPFVPAEQVDAFKKEMAAAKVDVQFTAHEGAKHAFTNPGATELGKKFELPLEYNKEADEKSWASLDQFLKGLFGS